MAPLIVLAGIALALEAAVWMARLFRHRKPEAQAPHEHREADDGGGWQRLDPKTGRIEPVEQRAIPWLYRHRRDRWPVRWP